jgi:hypothetical protein
VELSGQEPIPAGRVSYLMVPMTNSKPVSESAFRRFALIFFAVFGGGVGLIYAAVLVIDPYDAGRFPTFMRPGINDSGHRFTQASHGRDSRFNAAVIGNSRGQMLDPAKLSDFTGLSFVQLTVPGSGPQEHMTMLRFFMTHHENINAIVLTVDEGWCIHDPTMPMIDPPFPLWLYRGDLEYLAHLLSRNSLTLAVRRIKLELGLMPVDDARGYKPYDTGFVRDFHPSPRPPGNKLVVVPLDLPFPAFELLDSVLAELPKTSAVVFLMSPVHQQWLDDLNPQIVADLPHCKAELERRAVERPHTAFLDYFVEGSLSRDAESFVDAQHFRAKVARVLERRIAEALKERE